MTRPEYSLPAHLIAPLPEVPQQPELDPKQYEVMQKLEQGIAGVLTDKGFAAYLRMLAKFHQYSFANSILIMVQKPDATLVNSYDRWQGLNRQVQKGEHGIKIFYPRFRKEESLETGEKEQMLVGYGIGKVFDISQTEGEELPERPAITDDTNVTDPSIALNLKASRWGIDEGVTFQSKEIHGHAQGYWDPSKRLIAIRKSEVMPVFSNHRTRTLAHELAHMVADHRGAIDRSDAETVAESAAFVVCDHFGIDTGQQSFNYVAGWAKDREVLKRNLSEIQKVSSKLITAIEGVGDPYADGFGNWESRNERAGFERFPIDAE